MELSNAPFPTYPVYGDISRGTLFRVALSNNHYIILKARKDINFFKAAEVLKPEDRANGFVDDLIQRGLATSPTNVADYDIDETPIFSLNEHFISYDQASYYSSLLGEFESRIPQYLHKRLAYYLGESIKTHEKGDPEDITQELTIEECLVDIISAWRENSVNESDGEYIKSFKSLNLILASKELAEIEERNIKKFGFHLRGVFSNNNVDPNFVYSKGMGEKLGYELFVVRDDFSLNATARIFSQICTGLVKGTIQLNTNGFHEVVDEEKEDHPVVARYLYREVDPSVVEPILNIQLQRLSSGELPKLYQVCITGAKGKLPGEPGYRSKALVF